MLNVGGPELLVILLLALIVLGPQRLPEAARQVGKFMGEVRRMSSGFQDELKSAFDEPTEAAARAKGAAATVAKPVLETAPAVAPTPAAAPVEPAQPEPGAVAKRAPVKKAAAKKAAAKKAAPRKRAAPLKAAAKPAVPS